MFWKKGRTLYEKLTEEYRKTELAKRCERSYEVLTLGIDDYFDAEKDYTIKNFIKTIFLGEGRKGIKKEIKEFEPGMNFLKFIKQRCIVWSHLTSKHFIYDMLAFSGLLGMYYSSNIILTIVLLILFVPIFASHLFKI